MQIDPAALQLDVVQLYLAVLLTPGLRDIVEICG
jgi:hypothetical protein